MQRDLRPNHRHAPRALAVSASALALAIALGAPTSARAAVPKTWTLEGALLAAGGGPASDGEYTVKVVIRQGAGGKILHEDGPLLVKVQGGRLTVPIGVGGGLAKAAEAQEFWTDAGLAIGIVVGSEPELGPLPIAAVPAATRAGVAEGLACSGCVTAAHLGVAYAGSANQGGAALDLACTGCVSVAELAFDDDVDLGGHSIKAKNATFAGDIVAKTMTAQSFAGDGSKLTGIAIPSGSCPSGQVVSGIASDGKLVCAAGGAGALPADGLDEISGGVLSTEFDDVLAAPIKDVAIPDNTGTDAVSTITVGDIGTAKDLKIKVKISNSDVGSVSMVLLPPDDKAKGILLCDPCGKTDEKSFETSWPVPTKPLQGDLAKYLGSSPKGTWTLKVKDTSYCVPQKPGNAGICDLQGKTDGKLIDWSITVHTVSKSKAQVAGDLIVHGGISSANGLLIGDASAPCSPSLYGRMRLSDPAGLELCNGTAWVAALPRPVFWQGGCGSNGATDWRYFCTSVTDRHTAAAYLDVASANVGTSTDPATGKITIKIAGFYRLVLQSWGSAAQRYWELHVNDKVAGEGRNYNAGSSNNTLTFDRVLWLDKGDTLNVRLYASDGTSWFAGSGQAGAATVARSSWWRVEYIGHNWKKGLVCGDGEVDPGEQCDDGNSKDDDACSNACKTNIPPVQAWSEVALNSQSPTLTMGTIAGIPGKTIVIKKLGICGDSDAGSGSNVFQLSGGGLNFTWESGQQNQGATHKLNPTPPAGASRGFTYADVNYTAQAGASLTIQWTYHYDWDGHRCTDTDALGKPYDDQTGSSVRAWVLYEYK